MSWEALRLTSKSPSELLHTLGPHGVDNLIRQALDVLWREYPPENRTLNNVRRRAQEVFDRNVKVWSSIKRPTPAAFFENLLPYPADGFFRQAMVLCWMMMPRTGGRELSEVRKIIKEIYERNLAAWEKDNRTFTHTPAKRASNSVKMKKRNKPPRRKGRQEKAKKKRG
ncbi:MAG TPA: hypothetical protein VGF52_03090 [Tepidisphaeraceae bacterium]